jgi:hypothetical protein
MDQAGFSPTATWENREAQSWAPSLSHLALMELHKHIFNVRCDDIVTVCDPVAGSCCSTWMHSVAIP